MVDPDRRRAELLDAAERCIARDGPDVPFGQVAAEAGYARTALYSVFPQREALVEALAMRHSGRLIERIDAVFAQPRPVRELLRDAVDVFCGFVADNPELYVVLMRGLSAEVGERTRPLLAPICYWATGVLRGVLHRTGGDESVAGVWASALLGGVLSAAEDWTARHGTSQAELVDHLTAFLWHGLHGAAGDDLVGPLVTGAEPW